MEEVRLWASLAAAAINGALFLYMVARAPRNTFVMLFTAILGAIAAWNLLEWVTIGRKRDHFYCLLGVPLSIVPALYFHLALHLNARVRVSTRWLLLGYGTAIVLLVPAVLALRSRAFFEFYESRWNGAFLALAGPILIAALVVLARRAATASPRERGLFAFPLAAGLVAVPLGLYEIAVGLGAPALQLSNAASVASGFIFAWGVFRYRPVFDAITHLRASTALALDALHQGVVTFDHHGTAVFCNDAAASLLGARPARLADLPRDVGDIFASGGQCYVKSNARILKVSATRPETPVRAAATVHLLVEDVTREYELLHELAQRESLASLGEAAATLAHEIRNPLAAIAATVETLARDPASDPAPVDLLRHEVRRLEGLVARSLDLARPIEFAPEPCDLNGLIERIVQRMPPPPRITVRPVEGLPEVAADPDLLGQVFVNVIRNAAEAGARDVEIATRSNGGGVVTRFFNPGPPIPPEVLGRLFLPFVTTKASGAGLGLALCKKIVTAHGGEITAANVDGGVAVEVRLPWMS